MANRPELREPPPDFAEQAERLMLAGRLAEARDLCLSVREQYPNHFEPHYLLGAVCMQAGDATAALEHFQQALTRAPDNVDLRYSLAVALQTLGRLAEALDEAAAALQVTPDDAELYRLHGNLLLALGRNVAGAASFRRADELEQTPARTAEAEAEAAMTAEQRVSLERLRGQLQGGEIRAAEEGTRALLAEMPRWAEVHALLAETMLAQDRLPEAESGYRTALALESRSASYWQQLGGVLLLQCKLEEAVSAYKHALALAGETPELYGQVGLALALLGQFAEGEAQCRLAVRQAPQQPSILVSTALVASLQGEYGRAQTLLERAVALAPNNVRAHLNLAMLRLKRGDYANGWAEYEWRTRLPGAQRGLRGERWEGDPLPGKTLLIYAEQGLGDTLQFVRFLPLARQRVGQVILEHPPELTALLQGAAGCDVPVARSGRDRHASDVDAVVGLHYDAYVPLLSLPYALGLSAPPPGQLPYLALQPERAALWQQRLPQNGAYRVGIVWAGNPRHMIDRLRSLTLAHFAPLSAVAGIQCYGLQRGDAAIQAQDPPPQLPFVDLGPQLNDFADAAALIMNLDLVIAADTAVAHLAGALGRPVWVLLPYDPDWRWLLNREDTPWYPSMRLFRQKRLGDWAGVMTKVVAELQQQVAKRTPARTTGPGA